MKKFFKMVSAAIAIIFVFTGCATTTDSNSSTVNYDDTGNTSIIETETERGASVEEETFTESATEEEPSVDTNEAEAEATVYEVPDDFTIGYSYGDYETYSDSTVSDSLIGDLVWFDGAITTFGTVESDNGYFYVAIITNENGQKWYTYLSTTDAAVDRSDAEYNYQQLGACIKGVYIGVSSSGLPTMVAHNMFTVSDGQTIDCFPGYTVEVKEELEMTTEQAEAMEKANEYLAWLHLSYNRLIDQLEFDGFTTEVATFVADNCGADWNANALASAQTYSDYMYMSKQGIYDQLVSEYGDHYTEDEAEYAINNVVADWNENAVKSAEAYLLISSYSKDGLIEQLEFDGFTTEQATYAAEQVGY